MKYYTVKVFANKIINDGDPNYTQEFKAYDCDDILCATYYQPNNTTGNQFIHPVMQKEKAKQAYLIGKKKYHGEEFTGRIT